MSNWFLFRRIFNYPVLPLPPFYYLLVIFERIFTGKIFLLFPRFWSIIHQLNRNLIKFEFSFYFSSILFVSSSSLKSSCRLFINSYKILTSKSQNWFQQEYGIRDGRIQWGYEHQSNSREEKLEENVQLNTFYYIWSIIEIEWMNERAIKTIGKQTQTGKRQTVWCKI